MKELLEEIEVLRAKLETQSQLSTVRAQGHALSGGSPEMLREDARGALYFAAATALEAVLRLEASAEAIEASQEAA